MENKSHALAAGTFVVLVLALLVGLAYWLTRDTREMRFYELSTPSSVTGLQPQASVRFKGVNVGKVTAIGFDRLTPGQVLIRIAVDDRAPITQSTFGSLGFQGVTGLAFVQLDDSGESRISLPDGHEPPPRIPMRPGLMAKLSDQGVSLLGQLEESSRRVNLLLGPDNQNVLMGAIGSVGQAGASLQQLAKQLDTQLPQLLQDANATLKTMQDTSVRVGVSADEARASARAFKVVTERMNEKGGTLDKLAQGVDTLAATGQNLNATTLPRLNHALEDTARSARRVSRTAETVSDNPQSLIFGSGALAPGPGEPGFKSSPSTP